jgi:hypothetical protein
VSKQQKQHAITIPIPISTSVETGALIQPKHEFNMKNIKALFQLMSKSKNRQVLNSTPSVRQGSNIQLQQNPTQLPVTVQNKHHSENMKSLLRLITKLPKKELNQLSRSPSSQLLNNKNEHHSDNMKSLLRFIAKLPKQLNKPEKQKEATKDLLEEDIKDPTLAQLRPIIKFFDFVKRSKQKKSEESENTQEKTAEQPSKKDIDGSIKVMLKMNKILRSKAQLEIVKETQPEIKKENRNLQFLMTLITKNKLTLKNSTIIPTAHKNQIKTLIGLIAEFNRLRKRQ